MLLLYIQLAALTAALPQSQDDLRYTTEMTDSTEYTSNYDMGVITEIPQTVTEESGLESSTIVAGEYEYPAEEREDEVVTFSPTASDVACLGEECKASLDVIKDYPLESDNFASDITKEELEELYKEDPKENAIDDTSLDTHDLVDFVHSFIAERDPMLQLYLSLCFLTPSCLDIDTPSPAPSLPHSPLVSRISLLLEGRLRESARNVLMEEIKVVRRQNKANMFTAIREGVGQRGVSVIATKNIIDAIKGIWIGVNQDLDFITANIHEIFYTQPLNNEAQVSSILNIASALERIPEHTQKLYKKGGVSGYHNYVSTQSWNSWKREQNIE